MGPYDGNGDDSSLKDLENDENAKDALTEQLQKEDKDGKYGFEKEENSGGEGKGSENKIDLSSPLLQLLVGSITACICIVSVCICWRWRQKELRKAHARLAKVVGVELG